MANGCGELQRFGEEMVVNSPGANGERFLSKQGLWNGDDVFMVEEPSLGWGRLQDQLLAELVAYF